MKPPKLIEWLILRFCKEEFQEEILGDLHEQYLINLEERGRRQAKGNYIYNGIRFINLRTIKSSIFKTNNAMFKNYIIIAVRNMFRQKLYSLINIGGLAIGIACSILLGLYVYTEISFDRFHAKADKIVASYLEYDLGAGEVRHTDHTPTALLPAMVNSVPEIERGVRIFYPVMFKPLIVAYEDLAFEEKGFCYADSTFFEIFSFEFVTGDKATALDDPTGIVITESTRTKYFGTEQAIGKTLTVGSKSFSVTGIVKDVPPTSTIKFDMVAPFSAFWKRDPIWGSANYQTFFELSEAVDPAILSSKIQSELRNQGISDPENSRYVGFGFTPLLDVHLYSDVFEGGDIKYLYIFGSIALLILLIAIINYANLATARAFYRSREVGLRKALGAIKGSIMAQIIGESFVTSLISMLLAMLIVYLMLPAFATITGAYLAMSDLIKPELILGIIVLYFIIALLSGIYPATKMASYKPAEILKGQFKGSGDGILIRKILISIQFIISISLVISTVVIYNQLNYINTKDLGYNKDNVLVIPISDAVMSKDNEFKSMILNNSAIRSVTIAGETPPNIQGGYSVSADGESSFAVVAAAIDESFLETFNIELIAGRNLSQNDLVNARESKEYSFILNESAAKLLGWSPQEIIDREINLNGRGGLVRGVVEDFHFRALYEEVTPLVLFTESKWAYNYAMLRLSNEELAATIEHVNSVWQEIDPESPLSYSFLDEEFADLHKNAARSGNLFTSFSIMAILIASLGLFGIVSFSMVQRAKEIGVRKVLGASTLSVLMLANREFLILILISFIVAGPLTFAAMENWLNGFAYHVQVGAVPLILGFLLTLIIAVATISFESLKAATTNPSETLRNE